MLKFVGPLLFILPLTAQQTLPDLIVTASRVAAPSDDIPFTTEILDSETLIENASRTLPQAFLNTPGVLVQQTTPAQGSPFIRGFTGRRNLLLQDGIRLNNSSWRGGPVQYWNTLDSQAINRVELIKSQGSVLYGSDAIGGTLNVFSKSSHFREREGAFYNGSAYYRFDTNSKSNIGRLEQTLGQGGKWGLTVGLSAKDIGDIRDSALGRMVGTGYQEHSFDAKFEYAVTDTLTLTATHTLLDQDDISRWHSTINNPGWTHGSSFTTAGTDLARDLDQERSLSYIRLDETETNLTWIDSWQATASFQKTQDSEFRVRSSGRADFRNLDVDTYGLTLQAKSGNLVWGADYYRDEIDAEGERNGLEFASNRPVADDSSYDSFALFANYQGTLGTKLRYDAGARFTYARAQWNGFRPEGALVDQSGESSWENLSFSLRGQYEIHETLTLFGGASQAFRAPNLDDLTGSQFALNGLDSRGSPNVDPETYITTEIGARYQNHNLTVELSAYYTFIDDGIIRVDDGTGGLITTNGSDGYIYGFEAKTTWNFSPQWELTAQASWQDGNQTTNGIEDTIRRLNPLNGSLALKWTSPTDRYWISGRIQGAARQDNLSTLAASDTQRIPVNGTPSYITANIYSGWQVRDNLQLNLALENLTDEDYRIHGSGQNAPGRNATLSVKYTW